MAEDLRELATRVEELAREVGELRRRLAALETRGVAPAGEPAAPPSPPVGTEAPVAQAAGPAVGVVPLVGRTLMVLGGAYLLRAVSDAGVLPPLAGAGAGLAYAVWWLGACDRAAAAGERLGATFHGLAAALVAFPLIFETTARFGTLPVAVAALALVAVPGLALAVAARRGLEEVAWIATLFAVATSLALLVATRELLAVALALLGQAVAVELVGRREGWGGLRWPPALALDGVVLLIASLLARPQGLPEGYPLLAPLAGVAVALALAVLYVVSVAARTLVQRRRVTPFEIAQTGAALALGVGGAEWVLLADGRSPGGLDAFVLALGAGCYALSFAFIDRSAGRGRTFYFYSTLALLLVLGGSRGLLPGAVLATLWLLLAVAAAWLGRRFDRGTLRNQGALYWTAGALASGLIGASWDGLFAPPGPWRELGTTGGLAIAAGALCWVLVLKGPGEGAGWSDLVPRALLIALTAFAAAAALARGCGQALAGIGGPEADAGVLATLRTAVLAGAGLLLAEGHRRRALPELRWLVYSVLVVGGLKLLGEDLLRGRPSTLFLSLAFYGGALALAPKRLRRA